MSQENVEIAQHRQNSVERAIAAFNARDVAAFAALTTPDFEWSPSMNPIEGERFLGAEGIRKYFDALGVAWEYFQIIPGELRDHAAGIIVLGHLEGRGSGSGATVESPLGMAFDLRDAKITRIRGFLDYGEALQAVGLAE
jgi:ketosteroid isomerase-like protein